MGMNSSSGGMASSMLAPVDPMGLTKPLTAPLDMAMSMPMTMMGGMGQQPAQPQVNYYGGQPQPFAQSPYAGAPVSRPQQSSFSSPQPQAQVANQTQRRDDDDLVMRSSGGMNVGGV